MRLPLQKRTRIVTWLAALGFVALLTAGPLASSARSESLFALVLIVDTALLIAFLSRRPAFALAVPAVVFGGLLIAGALKFQYLTTPLLAPDLVYFLNRDLLDVARRYPSVMIALAGGAVLIPGLLILVWWLDRPRLFAHLRPAPRRLAQGVGALAAMALLIAVDTPRGPFADVFDKGMWAMMNNRNYIVDFFASFWQTQIVVPKVAADAEKGVVWTQSSADNPPACAKVRCATAKFTSAQEHPDIVSILEESTFDPSMLKDCTIAQFCKLKMFAADGRTRAHGFATMHVWGGGTWTSEFALLTGLNHLSFGEAGLYAPYNLAPRVAYTLPRVLHAAGYRVIAIYPMTGDFINARNAYKDYGFDKFYDGQDYGLSWESPDSDLVQVFDRIYAREKKTIGKQPLFVMLLTLREHGPHMDPYNTMPPPFDKPLFPGHWKPKELDDWLNLNLANYLYRVSGSDAAIAHIEKTLLDSGRPALLFHFGDHQPSFDGAIRELKKIVPASVPDANFITYYMLKTNYKPARGDYNYPVLDISFAGSLILDIAGVPKDAFFQANALMRERCQGRYLDCPNKPLLDSYDNYVFDTLHAVHE
ncbi:MAG: sulfatase-like hydrolase/transferase [Xanthomonadaceae bacterium]|nr:sulfatase-like hydrolase/transferase [Xanthomonadaceae bacterium]